MNRYGINAGGLNAGGTLIVFDVAETAIITNPEPIGVVPEIVTETAVITNPAIVIIDIELVNDKGLVVSEAYPTQTTTVDVAETAVLDDAAYPAETYQLDVAETAVLDDTLYPGNPYVDVAETAVVISAALPVETVTEDVAESAVLNDAAYPGQSYNVAETAVVTSTAYPSNTFILDVAETAVLDDAVSFSITTVEDVAETAVVVSAAYTGTSIVVVDVVEQGFISSSTYTRNATDLNTVWTANVVNWAMSTYTGLNLTGKAGRYAVSPTGLYVEGTTYADGVMETGEYDFKILNVKRVSRLFAYGGRAAEAVVRVTTDDDTPIDYTLDIGDQVTRCKLNRGVRGSYYKFRVTSDGYMNMKMLAPLVESFGRVT